MVAIAFTAFLTMAGQAADKDRDWAAYGGDKGGTKYSPLDQINKDTIKNLKIAWRKSGVPEELKASFPDANAPANYQHTPLMVGGVLYMSSAVGAVVALDPATGKTLWFDTLPPRTDGQGLARGGATRSLAYWTDGRDARIVTNVGANLVALNAKTGKRYPDFGENGQVDLTKGFERAITGWRWSSGPLVV
jgi:quinoprotein glucose dehydrogenase